MKNLLLLLATAIICAPPPLITPAPNNARKYRFRILSFFISLKLRMKNLLVPLRGNNNLRATATYHFRTQLCAQMEVQNPVKCSDFYLFRW